MAAVREKIMTRAADDVIAERERCNYLTETLKVMNIELQIWRERHPTEAIFISEEARAKAQNREPQFISPIVRG